MLKGIIILLIGAGIGALVGYFGKCNDGQCPLTATPLRGAMWGTCIALIIAYPMIIAAFRKPIPESENVTHISSANELQSLMEKPDHICLIDFHADWCAPCRTLAPTINQLADDFKDNVDIIKINVDKFSALAQQYQASSIPLVIITVGGVEKERITGARSFETYAALLNKYKNK